MARSRTSPISLSIAAFLVLVATIFFWLSAFSVPFIKGIFYIHTRVDNVKYGNFGWCAPDFALCYRHVGYAWYPEIPQNVHLTGSLILVALTAGFGSLAFFSLLHSAMDLRSGLLSFILVLWTNLLAFISFLLVLICFGTAHHRFNEVSLDAHYGAAFVLVIIGWFLYVFAIPLVVFGWFRERHYRHKDETLANNNVNNGTTTTTKRQKWF